MIRDPRNGYLTDTTFPDRFHRELSPSWLSYVGAHGGCAPRRLDRPFTYLDLGCGFAYSTIVNAGAFPEAEFHACDFNPAHIEGAARRVARLGVKNVSLHDGQFEDLLAADLPAFDFIVLHGIYSWVSPEVRGTIHRIISQKLNPDGLVYLSYNCLPGWAAEAPLRKLILELAESEEGEVERRASLSLSGVRRLSNTSFRYFRDNPAAVDAVESFSKDPINYLAHEFLNGTWQPYYCVDIADDMARAGVAYLGSATLADNHPMLVLDKQAAESIAALPTARLQRLATDFAVNRRFRRDVFIREMQPWNARSDSLAHLDDVIIGCVTEVEQISTTANIPRGNITFQDDFIRELREHMGRGPMSVGEVAARLSGPRRNPIEIRQNLFFLVAAGTLMPFARARGHTEAAPSREAANQVVRNSLEQIVGSSSPAFVPCKLLGNGVLVGVDEALQATGWLAGKEIPPPARMLRLGLL
jgi:hypothetical protein